MDEKLSPEVWKIAFSAFFADLGYQGAIALLPLLLAYALRLPIYVYGLIEALNYGGGAITGPLFTAGKIYACLYAFAAAIAAAIALRMAR